MASSSYQVIARRYRPQLFTDVIGQQAVVDQLRNEITESKLGHAYLFCGPRGTGKTSMARLFAKALNCEKGPTAEPCGECHHCLEIAAGTHLDVMEVDAATYTSVANMRELLEGLNRMPFSARRKVYIIDEVHMLSISSFNALLKSLEEPPEHVVFILATTNPEKIPETVVSRCRRCTFDRISLPDIMRSLDAIIRREGVTVPDDERQAVLSAVALASEGGLRDAQVMLDQLIALGADELRLETVRSLLGVVESDLFLRLLKALAERNTGECILLVADLVDKGRDLGRFVKMFLAFLRDSMILKAGGSPELSRVADATNAEYRQALDSVSLPFLLNMVQQFLDLEARLRSAAPPRFLLEFTLIKLTAIDPRLVIDPDMGGRPSGASASAAGSSSRPAAPRGPSASAGRGPSAGAHARDSKQVLVAREAAPELEDLAPAIEAIPTTDGDRWGALVEKLGAAHAGLRTVISRSRLVEVNQSRLVFQLPWNERVMRAQFDNPVVVESLRRLARELWQRPLFPVIQVEDEPATAPEPEPAALAPVYDVAPEDDYAGASYTPPPPKPRTPASVSAPMSLDQAFEAYPAFREACNLIEKHFGALPTLARVQNATGTHGRSTDT